MLHVTWVTCTIVLVIMVCFLTVTSQPSVACIPVTEKRNGPVGSKSQRWRNYERANVGVEREDFTMSDAFPSESMIDSLPMIVVIP